MWVYFLFLTVLNIFTDYLMTSFLCNSVIYPFVQWVQICIHFLVNSRQIFKLYDFCKILEVFIKYQVNGSLIYEKTTDCRLLKLYNIMLCYQNTCSKQLCVTVDKIQKAKKNTRKISL